MSSLKVAFGNKARSGKDTAAKYLQEKYGGDVVRTASKVYECAESICEIMGQPPNVKNPALLQLIGGGLRSIYGDNVWVDATLKNITENKNYYIPDLRYLNEARAYKENGFVLIRIDRADREIDRDPTHPSETQLDNYDGFDYVIENNGTLSEFYKKIDSVVMQMMV